MSDFVLTLTRSVGKDSLEDGATRRSALSYATVSAPTGTTMVTVDSEPSSRRKKPTLKISMNQNNMRISFTVLLTVYGQYAIVLTANGMPQEKGKF
jgi:hypothetical protein